MKTGWRRRRRAEEEVVCIDQRILQRHKCKSEKNYFLVSECMNIQQSQQRKAHGMYN